MSLDETVALSERLGSAIIGTLEVGVTGALRPPWVVAGSACQAQHDHAASHGQQHRTDLFARLLNDLNDSQAS